AERHFEKALEMNARIRARIWVAHTQHDYARMLVARDQPGDREKAGALAAQVRVTAREGGVKPLGAAWLELRASAVPASGERGSHLPPKAGHTRQRRRSFGEPATSGRSPTRARDCG